MMARIGLLVLAALAGAAGVYAQDAEPASDTPAAPSAEEQAKFEETYAQWKEVRTRLEEIREEYQAATKDRRKELEKEHASLVESVEELAPALKELSPVAEGLYRADPKHADASEYVVSSAVGALQNDDYEEALRLGTLSIDNDYENKAVYDLAGMSAFKVMDLDKAEDYPGQAKEEEVLSPEGDKQLSSLSEYREFWTKEQKIRKAEAQADDLPRVLISTSKGDITLELFENEAPNAVANFVSLVEDKFYDGVVFHRVLPGFMAQGGDPTGTGSGGPGYNIKCECHQRNYRRHFRGSISMAHAGRDTGGSQFFLMFGPSGPAAGYDLDGKHTVFGRIVDGMDVLAKLQRINPDRPRGEEPDKIVTAKVLRKRDHEYQPETQPE